MQIILELCSQRDEYIVKQVPLDLASFHVKCVCVCVLACMYADTRKHVCVGTRGQCPVPFLHKVIYLDSESTSILQRWMYYSSINLCNIFIVFCIFLHEELQQHCGWPCPEVGSGYTLGDASKAHIDFGEDHHHSTIHYGKDCVI